VAPLAKAIPFYVPAVNRGSAILLYKGPEVEAEIAEASAELKKRRIGVRILERYTLPDGMGERTIVELTQ
jgi:16S rRNA G527 N7-methylase RsmG